ncbi:MAG: hypothetical protein RL563_51, partial [Pseudomonadota bacterium]
GEQGNNDSPQEQGGRAQLSKDGTWITFESSALNLTNGLVPGGGARTVIHNNATGETLALDNAGNFGNGIRPAISNDLYGRFVAFFSSNSLDNRFISSGVYRYDRHQLPVAVAKIDATTTQPISLNDTVTLDGSSSHNEPNAKFFAPKPQPDLTYQWSQLAGPSSVSLSSTTTVRPNFKAETEGEYRFRLIVSDGIENSEPVTLTVEIGSAGNSENQKPEANAGSDSNEEINNTIILDGSQSSDPDNGPNPSLSFSWTQISGPNINLKNSNSASPSFTPIQAGNYIFRLVVNDGKDFSNPDVVTITVGESGAEVNIPPQAIAGDNEIFSLGQTITLDGSQSFDPDSSQPLSFEWTQTGGPQVLLSDVNSVRPSFNANQVGSYSFRLIVSDNETNSQPNVVTITVRSSSANQSPIARVKVLTNPSMIGAPIKLSGVESNDPDKTTRKLKHQWIQRDGPVSVALKGANTSSPTFTPTTPGDYVFDLAVFDGKDWSTTTSLTVHTEASIEVLSPAEGETVNLGTRVLVGYFTSGISPKASLKASLLLIDDFTGEIEQIPSTIRPKAKPSGFFNVAIPNNIFFQSTSALFQLCVSDQFCGLSNVFSIE